MIGFKEEFYSNLRNDFSGCTTNSFLYTYMEAEKNKNFRLQLKKRFAKLKNLEESKEEYLLFIVNSLLEDAKLQKSYEQLESMELLLKSEGYKKSLKDKKQKEKIKEALKSLQKNLQAESEEINLSTAELAYITKDLLEHFQHADGRKDVYVQLKEYFLDYENGDSKEEEYLIQLLEILINNSRFHLSKESHNVLLDYGMLLGGNDLYTGIRKDRDKYCEILPILRGQNLETTNKKLGFRKVKKITEELLTFILLVDVRGFLYDVGYPEKENTETSVAAARKKDRTMDMLDAYCRVNHISLRAQNTGANLTKDGAEFLSPEKKKKCQMLFKLLKKSENSKVLVPLAIDACTGAGIYIIGKDYYHSIASVYGKIQGSCCYSILYQDDLHIDDEFGFSFTIDIKQYSNFPNLDEAEKWFKRQIEMETFLMGYRDYNEEVPVDCPENFRIYFEKEKAKEDLGLEEEKEQIRELLNKEFLSYKK